MSYTTTSDDAGELFDFSTPYTPVRFKIDADMFTLVREVPAELMMVIANKFDDLTDQNKTPEDVDPEQFLEGLRDIVRMLFVPASAELFIERMSNPNNPIGLMKVLDIIPVAMEKAGMVPTEPSRNSADGPESPGTGNSLTGSAPAPELTSADSRPTDLSALSIPI